MVSEAGGQGRHQPADVGLGLRGNKNATDAARVSGEAVEAARSANKTITRLGDSGVEIAKVIEVITSIAQQTNLLDEFSITLATD